MLIGEINIATVYLTCIYSGAYNMVFTLPIGDIYIYCSNK